MSKEEIARLKGLAEHHAGRDEYDMHDMYMSDARKLQRKMGKDAKAGKSPDQSKSPGEAFGGAHYAAARQARADLPQPMAFPRATKIAFPVGG